MRFPVLHYLSMIFVSLGLCIAIFGTGFFLISGFVGGLTGVLGAINILLMGLGVVAAGEAIKVLLAIEENTRR